MIFQGVDPQEFARPMNRQDVFYAGSIKNLKEFKQEGNNMQSYRGSVLSIPRSVVGQAVSSLSQAGALCTCCNCYFWCLNQCATSTPSVIRF